MKPSQPLGLISAICEQPSSFVMIHSKPEVSHHVCFDLSLLPVSFKLCELFECISFTLHGLSKQINKQARVHLHMLNAVQASLRLPPLTANGHETEHEEDNIHCATV